MISTAEAVKEILQRSFFIEEALALGIINLSSLARYLKPDIEEVLKKKVEIGAVVMALKRHSLQIKGGDRSIHKWLGRCPDILVRSNLVELTYANSESLLTAEKQFISEVEGRQGVFFTFTRGLYETTIIAGRNLKDKIIKDFRREKLVKSYEDLSAVSLQLAEDTALVPGVYSFILKALFLRGINVMEVVSTLNEFTIILEEGSADLAFSTLTALQRSAAPRRRA